MATPYLFRHPDSGIYYFRIAIPRALKGHLKQREWKKSLKTRDPIEAKQTARLVTLQVEYLFRELVMPKKDTLKLSILELLKRPDGTVEAKGIELNPDKVEEEIKLLHGVLGTQEPKTIAPVTLLADVIEDYCEEKVLDKS